MWWYDVRTVGWVLYHFPSKFYDGLIGSYTSLWPGVVREEKQFNIFLVWQTEQRQALRLLSVSVQQIALLVRRVIISHYCLRGLQPWWHTAFLNFFFLWDVMWHHSINCYLDSASECWTYVSSHMTAGGMKLLTSCTVSVQNLCGNFFSCLFECISIFVAPNKKSLWNSQAMSL